MDFLMDSFSLSEIRLIKMIARIDEEMEVLKGDEIFKL